MAGRHTVWPHCGPGLTEKSMLVLSCTTALVVVTTSVPLATRPLSPVRIDCRGAQDRSRRACEAQNTTLVARQSEVRAEQKLGWEV